MSSEMAEIASFISSRQKIPEHLMGNIGVDAGEIQDFLEEFGVRFVLERSDRGIVGALGVDHDPEIGRTWLHGPHVDSPDWDDMAELLWHRAQVLIPATSKELEIAYGADNAHLVRFGARHGFKEFSNGFLLSIDRERATELPFAEDVGPAEPSHHASIILLHSVLFPGVWPTGPTMIERVSEDRHLLVVMRAGEVVGYTFVECKPQFGEGAIEFIGVAEADRGRGVGKKLLCAAVRRIFSYESIPKVELFVRAENEAALNLYQSAGFTRTIRLIGARKPLP